MSKDDASLKTVKCNTCSDNMQIDKNAKGGYCYKCVASGRAFMIPEALEKAPSNDTLLFDDTFAERLKTSSKPKKHTTVKEKVKKEIIKPKTRTHFGQTTFVDKCLIEKLNPEEIVTRAKKEIPRYQGDWVKLINLRRYHLKSKGKI